MEQAFKNRKQDTPMVSFYFTYEDVLKIKEFVRTNGIGNSKNATALHQLFFWKFARLGSMNLS